MGFINALPVFIASDPTWAARFAAAGVPIVGDDIKSQVGATTTHRVLAKLFEDRGVRLERTYQLTFGGNTDFRNCWNDPGCTRRRSARAEPPAPSCHGSGRPALAIVPTGQPTDAPANLLGGVVKGSLIVRSLRGVLAASVCLLGVPVALLFQLIVGSGAEIVLHLVLGVGFLLTAFAVFDFAPPRWLPWVGCLSIGALGVTFLLEGISQLLRIDWLTYLAFQILGQQVEAWSGDVFLVWCSATVLLMSHGKVKLFGIGVMALAVSAEIYSQGVRYFGSGAGGVSPLLKLVLLLPFVWLLLESSKKIPLSQRAKNA